MIQPTLINIHPNEYSQELHYYPSAAKLDKSVGSCNTLNDLPSKVCVPIKTEDSYIYICVWNDYMKKWIKILAKDMSCKCKCRFDERKCNSDQWWNKDKCWCECKKRHVCEKVIFGILQHVVVKMENI